jgi:O-antigen ligase
MATQGIAYSAGGAVPKKQGMKRHLWILAVLPVLVIPFENQVRIVGFSLAKLTIIPLFLGVMALSFKDWIRVLRHKVFISAAVFVIVCSIVESFHPQSDWEFIYRTLQMFMFGTLIATVSIDRETFHRLLYAIAVICSLLAVYLVYNFYGIVNMEVSGFKQAGTLRDKAFEQMSLETGINILGYTVGLGAVVALSYLFSSKTKMWRIFWGGIYVLCAIGSFIPLSRGAFVAFIIGSLLVLSRNFTKVLNPGAIALFIVIGITVVSLVPEALTERYMVSNSEQEVMSNKKEGRVLVYTAALDSLPEYWMFGIGAGNYWNGWAAEHGFGRVTPNGFAMVGPHNGFIAAWIYFGLPGFLLFCLVCAFAAFACPRSKARPFESGVLLGMLGLGLMWMMFTHSLYLKPFGVILGLIVGGAIGIKLEARRNARLPFGVVPEIARPVAMHPAGLRGGAQR